MIESDIMNIKQIFLLLYCINSKNTMKIRHLFLLLLSNLLLFGCTFSNKTASKFNLDFEKIENGFPTGWNLENHDSNYLISVDSVNVKSGKYSVAIEFQSDSLNSIACLQYTFPENYPGKEIKLSGYIQTENVDGIAFLFIAIEPNIAMYELKDTIFGTNDWKRYEITAALDPAITKEISIFGGLFGEGKIWLDDFKVEIDGRDVQYLKPYKQKKLPLRRIKNLIKVLPLFFPN